MIHFMISKMTGALAAILGASILAFVFLRVLPGDPARLIVGPLATPQAIHEQEKAMGLGQPIYEQYWHYISGFVRGDWGFSYSTGSPVRDEITTHFPATAELALYAFVFCFGLAVILALVATYRRQPIVDGAVRTLAFLGLGIPPFWLALVVLIVFSQDLHLLPGPEGRLSQGVPAPPTLTGLYTVDALLSGQLATVGDALWHLILPAITLGLAPLGYLTRLLRANLLDISREPFILVARSKGKGRWAAFARHALPNAFFPTLTAGGLLLAQLLAGSVLVEKVFNWPGIGSLIVDSILRQDYAVVQAFILLSAVSYVVVNFLVDIGYGLIDPRVRISPAAE